MEKIKLLDNFPVTADNIKALMLNEYFQGNPHP